MGMRSFALGFLAAIVLTGCAGFAFKYYGLEGVSYEAGKLLGPKPNDDIPFANCAPTAQVKHPCVVMFATEFHALKLDYEDISNRLKACEHGGNGGTEL